MIGQPSSPGICVSVLRFGGVKLIAGEAAVCIDIAVTPKGPAMVRRTASSRTLNSPLRAWCKAAQSVRRDLCRFIRHHQGLGSREAGRHGGQGERQPELNLYVAANAGGDSVARMSATTRGCFVPDIAEPVIGRAFARPVGSSGLLRSRLRLELG